VGKRTVKKGEEFLDMQTPTTSSAATDDAKAAQLVAGIMATYRQFTAASEVCAPNDGQADAVAASIIEAYRTHKNGEGR
jgi:hypothetical protein